MPGIETMLQEKRVFPPPADLVKQANIPGMEAYRKMVAEAERDFASSTTPRMAAGAHRFTSSKSAVSVYHSPDGRLRSLSFATDSG